MGKGRVLQGTMLSICSHENEETPLKPFDAMFWPRAVAARNKKRAPYSPIPFNTYPPYLPSYKNLFFPLRV